MQASWFMQASRATRRARTHLHRGGGVGVPRLSLAARPRAQQRKAHLAAVVEVGVESHCAAARGAQVDLHSGRRSTAGTRPGRVQAAAAGQARRGARLRSGVQHGAMRVLRCFVKGRPRCQRKVRRARRTAGCWHCCGMTIMRDDNYAAPCEPTGCTKQRATAPGRSARQRPASRLPLPLGFSRATQPPPPPPPAAPWTGRWRGSKSRR